MTSQAFGTYPGVTVDVIMFIGHIVSVVFMAVDAAKYGIVVRLNVAIGAIIPNSAAVISPGDREVQIIMIKVGIFPVRNAVAGCTVC